jgi:hypothetical protein
MLNSPTGQLVGGMSERYVRYADISKPTSAEAVITHKRAPLFIFLHLLNLQSHGA